jgi:predicted dehydrogenase
MQGRTTVAPAVTVSSELSERRRPRVGFLGVGWIGLHRLRSLTRAELAEVVAIADPDPEAVQSACATAGGAAAAGSLNELLEWEPDGVVIATPNALHLQQALQAIERGAATFCQKPLARTARETWRVIDAAREANVLLGVDFSYRHLRGVQRMRQLIQSGALGEVFAVDLTFHNAYGPDKPWFYQRELSGGGCVLDLGIHLIDLAGWLTGDWAYQEVRSRLWHQGRELDDWTEAVEDCAFADWRTGGGAAVRLACSWRLSAGQDALIEAVVYCTRGAVAVRNIDGSFYDFVAEHWEGTRRTRLDDPPNADSAETITSSVASERDEWGGKALIGWARALVSGATFNGDIVHAAAVAELVDEIYRRAAPPPATPPSLQNGNGMYATRREAARQDSPPLQ